MSKILFIDIDGTLYSMKKRTVPDSAIEAIHKARENGHKVYICSGRSMAEIYPEILAIGFDGIIGGNGGYVEENGKAILHQALSEEETHHVIRWCEKNGLELLLETNEGLFPSEGYPQVLYRIYRKLYGIDPNYDKFVTEMIKGRDLYTVKNVNKISFLLEDWKYYEEAQKEFPDLFVGYWGGDAGRATNGDVTRKGVSKANGIRYLLNYLHRDGKDAVAFGDEPADIPMFELCGISVAMGNATEKTKEAADYVTEDIDEDGLYKAFDRLGLLQR